MTEEQTFVLVLWPVLMGLAAIGALLLIKVARRRDATHPPSGDVTEVVPARPLSAQRSARLLRNYLIAAVIIIAALVAWAASLFLFG